MERTFPSENASCLILFFYFTNIFFLLTFKETLNVVLCISSFSSFFIHVFLRSYKERLVIRKRELFGEQVEEALSFIEQLKSNLHRAS